MTSFENNYSSLQNNWADLPIELLTIILDKVTMLQDYIQFGAVCKSWYFVTREQKQKRQRKLNKEPPLLHIPVADNPNERALYSVSKGKIYNYRFSIPYRKKWCGASHGCLAISDQNSITKDLYITLFNPFSGGTIQLPLIMDNVENYQRFRDSPDFMILDEFQIYKVILSCDPFLYPDDYVVAVIYGVNRKLLWLKSGQRKWNLGVSNWGNCPYDFVMGFSDILFLGGLLYGIRFYQENELYFIDEFDDLSDSKVEESKRFKHFTLCKMRNKFYDFIYDTYNIFKSYILESSNGNILFIRRIYCFDKNKEGRLNTMNFKIYKLMDPDNGRGEWIEIKNLEKDDVLFLGPNNSVCIPASSVPNCKSNSIYYTDESTPHPYYCELGSHEAKDMGVFHLKDRSWEPHFVLHPSVKFMSPAAWISPTLN